MDELECDGEQLDERKEEDQEYVSNNTNEMTIKSGGKQIHSPNP